ncbi:VWA domain-containing protein [Streptomyces thermoviolaceus]|uniref:VWA domain-containing protein n=1 Tax=Streptomyces thermoviolaceus TaxID=1952 RepID=UPI0033A61EA9
MDRFDPRGRRNRALLVGVSEYDFRRPEETDGVSGNLPAVRHSLRAMRDALRGGGVFADRDIEPCASPTLDDFTEKLRGAAQEADGLLLCYFAGHGAVPSAGHELFLQMRNARIVAGAEAVFPGAAFFSQVLAVLARSRAQRIVVILDCCFAGNAARVWQNFSDHRRTLVLMAVQANRLIDSGDGSRATPFTQDVAELLRAPGEISALRLYELLRERMVTAHRTTTQGDLWLPDLAAAPGVDVLLGARPAPDPATVPFPVPSPSSSEESSPSPEVSDAPPVTGAGGRREGGTPDQEEPVGPGRTEPVRRSSRAVLRARLRRFARRVRNLPRFVVVGACLVLVGGLVAGCLLGFGALSTDDHGLCSPPLELRLLTDPDLEPVVSAAANAYLASDANLTGDGCRRTGITVYSAGAGNVVNALHRQTDPWQEPVEDDVNPQRDVGPQPDVWIPASASDVERVTADRSGPTRATLQPDAGPFVYAPVVLAVPQQLAGRSPDERAGQPLSRLVADMRKRAPDTGVLRADPEGTDAALLATVGLYGDGTDPRTAEQSVRPVGAPARTSRDLLCALAADSRADRRTAALVPEFLLSSGVDCAPDVPVPRTAEYPDDVPPLTPTFVRVRWEGGDRDRPARDDAVRRFRAWLTGKDGLAAFEAAGFRSATTAGHPLLDPDRAGAAVLRSPGALPGTVPGTAMDDALARYRSADGPGRVLYLLDSSSSMFHQWPGPGGGPGILKQSLGGLGPDDQYEVWAVYERAGGRHHEVLLPFGHHERAAAERTIDARARTRDAEADPHAALLEAVDTMARRGADDARPQLVVFITDDEDVGRLSGDRFTEVLDRVRSTNVTVDPVSLTAGACDQGRPDARIADVSHGRCLDADDDLGTELSDEVARVGTGEER